MALVTVYMHRECHLCREAIDRLKGLQQELGFDLELVDIKEHPRLLAAYFERVPVIALEGEELCDLFLDEDRLRASLAGKLRWGEEVRGRSIRVHSG